MREGRRSAIGALAVIVFATLTTVGRGAQQPGTAGAEVEDRGGPHPLDRCSSQLRWNPGS